LSPLSKNITRYLSTSSPVHASKKEGGRLSSLSGSSTLAEGLIVLDTLPPTLLIHFLDVDADDWVMIEMRDDVAVR
jgi:hypothetical protein